MDFFCLDPCTEEVCGGYLRTHHIFAKGDVAMAIPSRPPLSQMMQKHGITVSVEPGAPINAPNLIGPDMDGWTYVVQYKGKEMIGAYWTGLGHRKESWLGKETMNVRWSPRIGWKKAPTPNEVLACLLSDAALWADNSIEDFCAGLRYKAGHRTAQHVYEACGEEYRRLHQVFGSLLNTLMYECDHDD